MSKIMENLDGVTLRGDILRDNEVVLVNQKAEFSKDAAHTTLGGDAYSFQLSLEKKPNLRVNDKCKLVTKDQSIHLSVIYLECHFDLLCFVTFVTHPGI